MPSSRPQVFGLSKDVTLAVLPRLYMQEVLIELGRRDIDFRQVLITTLHDVMVREYQQLDSQSEPTTPDVTCHVTRRVGYGFYDPSSWAGELVGRRGVPVDRYIESYRGDAHMDAPTDLSMRSVDREEVREQERRDTKESYQIVTARRTDQERWSHAHAYTEYNTHRQEMSHDHMPQEAENRKIFDRPSSEDEDKSPLERRDEYGRDPSTSSVSQDEEYRYREQEENNATLSSDASTSPDTRPPDRHSQSSITATSSECTAAQETPQSQYQNQPEVNVSDTTNRPTSLGSRFIYRKSGRSYSRKKITHNLPTLPVPQQSISSSQTQTETDEDGHLRFSAASMQRVPRGKRKTDKKDVCKSIATVPADEATSSKRSKRHDSGDLTVHHTNGISPAYQRPSEDKIEVEYSSRDIRR
ncbi:uncharacterized protein [Branchiostoma lanceolatum]|uniref:uncharacterized protein n=1 Tax=Branchiostoma lanceolatum TaxID=7740 RepID=UPI0034564B28